MQVSLIIATFNQSESLMLLLQSIEMQTIIPDEIIIADDGSGDQVKKVINEVQKNSFLKIKHSWQENLGFRAAKSRNKAIAKSNFEYIIMVDGDMILHPKFIQDHINNSKIGFYVQGSRALLSEHHTNKIFENAKKNKNFEISFFSAGLGNRKNSIHSSFLSKFSDILNFNKDKLHSVRSCNIGFYKKDCIAVNGFNNKFEGWGREDSEFILRLLNKGLKRKNVRFNLIQYHLWHNESSREHLKKNTLMLDQAINNHSNWCDDGIDKYL